MLTALEARDSKPSAHFLKPLQKAPSFPTASSGSGLPRLPAASLQCLLRPQKACPALFVCVHLALFLLEASVSGFRTCVLSDLL